MAVTVSTQPTPRVRFSPTTGINDPLPKWVDLASRLKGGSTRRGRSGSLDRMPTGSASLQLNNFDRALDPTYTASPYYNGGDGVTPSKRIEIAVPVAINPVNIFGYFPAGDADPANPGMGARGYWSLNETSGVYVDAYYSQNLTPNGTYTRGVAGINPGNKAVLLNGNLAGTLTVAAIGAANAGVGTTWSMWVNIPSSTLGAGGFLLSTSGTSGTWGMWLTPTALGFNTNRADIYGITHNGRILDRWVNIAFTYISGSVATSKIWIDGVPQVLSQIQGTPGAVNVEAAFMVGAMAGSGLYPVAGTYDEIMMGYQTPTQGAIDMLYATGGGFPIFSGFISDIVNDWPSEREQYIDMTLVDLTDRIANAELPTSTTWPQELSSARINRVLDQIGWPSAWRSIQTGQVSVQGVTLGTGITKALDHLDIIAQTEVGLFYVDATGAPAFLNRTYRQATTAPKVVFGSDFNTTTEMPYTGLNASVARSRIYNKVNVTRIGGSAPQSSSDATSIARHGVMSLPRDNQFYVNDADALAASAYLLGLYKDPKLWITEMTLKPQRDDRLWRYALGLKIGDKVTVIYRPKSGTTPFQQDVLIEGVNHDWGRSEWTTTFSLSPADVASSGGTTTYWIIGHPTQSKLGVTTKLGF